MDLGQDKDSNDLSNNLSQYQYNPKPNLGKPKNNIQMSYYFSQSNNQNFETTTPEKEKLDGYSINNLQEGFSNLSFGNQNINSQEGQLKTNTFGMKNVYDEEIAQYKNFGNEKKNLGFSEYPRNENINNLNQNVADKFKMPFNYLQKDINTYPTNSEKSFLNYSQMTTNQGNIQSVLNKNSETENENRSQNNPYLQFSNKTDFFPYSPSLKYSQIARFFVIKSVDEDNIHKSIKFRIWCSTFKGNQKLQKAFKDAENAYPIYLLFSVNGSGRFLGLAQMTSEVDYHANFNFWSQGDKWKGFFFVVWLIIKDVPNKSFRHITNDYNEGKPITSSRDTQELHPAAGMEALKIFKEYAYETSILDDFQYFEKKNDVISKNFQGGKANQVNFQGEYEQNNGMLINNYQKNFGDQNFENRFNNGIPDSMNNLNYYKNQMNNQGTINILNNPNISINYNQIQNYSVPQGEGKSVNNSFPYTGNVNQLDSKYFISEKEFGSRYQGFPLNK